MVRAGASGGEAMAHDDESVVFECPTCGERAVGGRRCEECNVFCRKVGRGGWCPHCDEVVAVSELVGGGW